MSTKFAPRLRVRAIRKSESLKTERFGALLEVEVVKICTTPARESDLEVKIVKTPGARDVFWSWKCVSRGRRRDFDTLQNTWQAQEFVRVAKTLAGVVDLKRVWNEAFRVAGAMIFALCDVDVWSLRRRICGRVANFMSRMCYFAVIISRGSYRTSYASAQLFRGRRNTFEASNWKSLKRIVILRSSVWSTCHFWRKSRRKASFFSFNATFLKEVSQKCFVLELQSFIFEGSLAEKLRFLSFKASILKEVSQKCLVLEFQSFIFEGSLAEKLGFLSFTASILKEVSQKCLVFDLESFIFEGSLAEKLRFLSFSASILKEVSQKCLVFDLQSFNFEGSSKSFESQIRWQPNHLTLNSFESDINWLSNHLNSAHPLRIGSLSLETSATALCGRYVIIKSGLIFKTISMV